VADEQPRFKKGDAVWILDHYEGRDWSWPAVILDTKHVFENEDAEMLYSVKDVEEDTCDDYLAEEMTPRNPSLGGLDRPTPCLPPVIYDKY